MIMSLVPTGWAYLGLGTIKKKKKIPTHEHLIVTQKNSETKSIKTKKNQKESI